MALVESKVVLITGGGSGIGRETAKIFARKGAKVVVADIAVEAGEETVAAVGNDGGEAVFVKCDVSQAVDVEAAVNTAVYTYGGLDCAFNNAGIEGLTASIPEYPEADWDRVIDINLRGIWLCMKYEIPQMIRPGGGAIVNAAPIAGIVGSQGVVAYTASKWGVNGITKVAALEYAKAGIRVNSVCPGVIATAMVKRAFNEHPEVGSSFLAATPLHRLGEPREIGETVVWRCSSKSSFVTSHNMIADGGLTAQ